MHFFKKKPASCPFPQYYNGNGEKWLVGGRRVTAHHNIIKKFRLSRNIVLNFTNYLGKFQITLGGAEKWSVFNTAFHILNIRRNVPLSTTLFYFADWTTFIKSAASKESPPTKRPFTPAFC